MHITHTHAYHQRSAKPRVNTLFLENYQITCVCDWYSWVQSWRRRRVQVCVWIACACCYWNQNRIYTYIYVYIKCVWGKFIWPCLNCTVSIVVCGWFVWLESRKVRIVMTTHKKIAVIMQTTEMLFVVNIYIPKISRIVEVYMKTREISVTSGRLRNVSNVWWTCVWLQCA